MKRLGGPGRWLQLSTSLVALLVVAPPVDAQLPADASPHRSSFVSVEGVRVHYRWETDLQYARWVADGELVVPDSATRAYLLRLASDEAVQAEVRGVYRDLVAPAYRAADERFTRAFGEHLRVIPLEERAIGYVYRGVPELIEPHIRRFLDEANERELRSSFSQSRR